MRAFLYQYTQLTSARHDVFICISYFKLLKRLYIFYGRGCTESYRANNSFVIHTKHKQNYFQFENNFYKPNKGVAMGSISGLVEEIFLQFYKHVIVKYMLENKNIVFYNRYVDDILIIFDDHKMTKKKY